MDISPLNKGVFTNNDAIQQVIRADRELACLSSKLCGFFQVVCCGRAAAQFRL